MPIDEIHYLIDAGLFDDAMSQLELMANQNNEIYCSLMKIEIKIIDKEYLKAKSLVGSVTGKTISDIDNAYLSYCRGLLWYSTKPTTEYADILKLIDKNLPNLEKTLPSNVILISKFYLLKSNVHRELGLIKLSLEIINSILHLLDEGINDALLMEVKMSRGHLLRLQGEYNESMDAYCQSLELNKKIKNQVQELKINANIGLIHLSKLEYPEAKLYLFKALTDYASPSAKAEILINIFFINFKEGRIDYDSLDLLEELSHFNPTIEKIQLIFNFAQGLVHLSKPRLSDKINALPIFEKLMHYDQDPEFQLWNMNFYCELLLDEYLAYRGPDIRTELSGLTDKLIITAKANNLYNSLVIGYLLRSKLYLIDFDLDNALQNLNRSTKIAKSKNFQLMLKEISSLTEKINDAIMNWQKLSEEGSQVYKISEETRAMKYLEEIVKILKM